MKYLTLLKYAFNTVWLYGATFVGCDDKSNCNSYPEIGVAVATDTVVPTSSFWIVSVWSNT